MADASPAVASWKRRDSPRHTPIAGTADDSHDSPALGQASAVNLDNAGVPVPPAAQPHSTEQPVLFRLRLIELDHYLATPLEHLDPTHSLYSLLPIRTLPVVRIWGRTPAGQAAVLHVHGAFPYLYARLSDQAWEAAEQIEQSERQRKMQIEAARRNRQQLTSPGPVTPPASLPHSQEEEDAPSAIHAFLSRFGSCIERALRELQVIDRADRKAEREGKTEEEAEAMRPPSRSINDENAPMPLIRGGRNQPRPLIHSLCVVRARSIYGYAPSEQPFIKISLYDPSAIRRVASILQSGAILGTPFEVFEGHIPFHLQVMADLNLFGMDFVDVGKGVNFRQPLPKSSADDVSNEKMARKVIVTTCNSLNNKHGRNHSDRPNSINIAYESQNQSEPSAHPFSQPMELDLNEAASRFWTVNTTPTHMLASIRRQKVTRCELEADCTVDALLNAARIERTPIETSAEETKLVRSLAVLWDGERERRKAIKRAQKRAERILKAEETGVELSATPSQTDPSISFTPLTPPPSAPRAVFAATHIDKAYAAHIARATAKEAKYHKRKREAEEGQQTKVEEDENAATDDADETNVRVKTEGDEGRSKRQMTQSPKTGSDAVAPMELDSQPNQETKSILVSSPAPLPLPLPIPNSNSYPLDDLEAMLQEVENVDDEADQPPSLLASAIKDAHTALSQSGRKSKEPIASRRETSSPLTPASKHNQHHRAVAATPVPVNIDDLPTAFSLSQLPLPIASVSFAGITAGSQLGGASQKATSFFFSQMAPSQRCPSSQRLPFSPTPRHSLPFPLSQRYSPHQLQQAASSYVSQLPSDSQRPEDDDSELELEFSPESQRSDVERGTPSSPSSSAARGWLDEEKLLASQLHYSGEDRPPDEEDFDSPHRKYKIQPFFPPTSQIPFDGDEEHQEEPSEGGGDDGASEHEAVMKHNSDPLNDEEEEHKRREMQATQAEKELSEQQDTSSELKHEMLTEAKELEIEKSVNEISALPLASIASSDLPPTTTISTRPVSEPLEPTTRTISNSPPHSLNSVEAKPQPHLPAMPISPTPAITRTASPRQRSPSATAVSTSPSPAELVLRARSNHKLRKPLIPTPPPPPAAAPAIVPTSRLLTVPKPRPSSTLGRVRPPVPLTFEAAALQDKTEAMKATAGTPPVPAAATVQTPPRTSPSNGQSHEGDPIVKTEPQSPPVDDIVVPASPALSEGGSDVIILPETPPPLEEPRSHQPSQEAEQDAISVAPVASQQLVTFAVMPVVPTHRPSPIKSQPPPQAPREDVLPQSRRKLLTELNKVAPPQRRAPLPLPLPSQSQSQSQSQPSQAPSIGEELHQTAAFLYDQDGSDAVIIPSSAPNSPLPNSDASSAMSNRSSPTLLPLAEIEEEKSAATETQPPLPTAASQLSLSLPMSTPSTRIRPSAADSDSMVDDNDEESKVAPPVAPSESVPLPPPSRQVITSMYTHDESPYKPTEPVRFDTVSLPSNHLVLHILRTPPPSAKSLIDSCRKYNIWPTATHKRPFFSKMDHWRSHQAWVTSKAKTGSATFAHEYVAAALGEFSKEVGAEGVRPPEVVEFLPPALPPSLPTNISLPAAVPFEFFHRRIGEGKADSRCALASSIPLPCVRTTSARGYKHAFVYTALPPTILQLAKSSKHWYQELKPSVMKIKRAKRRLKRAATAVSFSEGTKEESSSSESESEEEEEQKPVEEIDLPRPASPKHDESCLLDFSYFQTKEQSADAKTPARTKTQVSAPRSGTSATVRLFSSAKKQQKLKRKVPDLPLPLSLAHSSGGEAPMLTPAVTVVRDPSIAPAAVDNGSTTSQSETHSEVAAPAIPSSSDSPATKVSKLSAKHTSPSVSGAPSSLDLRSSALPNATAAPGKGVQTQQRHSESQVEGPPPMIGASPVEYHYGATPTSNLGKLKVNARNLQRLTLLSVEIHACSRGNMLSDPRHDCVQAILYSVRRMVHGEHEHEPDLLGVLLCPHVHQVAVAATQTTFATTTENMQSESCSSKPSTTSVPRSCSNCCPDCPLPMLTFPDPRVIHQTFSNEASLLDGFVSLVHQLDPDIIMGWEIQKNSLGYLVERAQFLGRDCLQEQLSRLLPETKEERFKPMGGVAFKGAERDKSNPVAAYSWSHGSGITIPGRIVLNLWRIMRDELKLTSYSFENVASHVLGKRFAFFPPYVKHRWFTSSILAAGGNCAQVTASDHSREEESKVDRLDPNRASSSASSTADASRTGYSGNGMYRVLTYYLERCNANLEIVDRLDVIGRTAELARVFGIKFYSVLERGSQFRVESMLLRLSKPQNFLLLSVSPVQRASQPAMEVIPLIMEPVSHFYTDPVIVLDFQSLYPSMMIAYNICFSTCLGRIPQPKQPAAQAQAAAVATAIAPGTGVPQNTTPQRPPTNALPNSSAMRSAISQQSPASQVESQSDVSQSQYGILGGPPANASAAILSTLLSPSTQSTSVPGPSGNASTSQSANQTPAAASVHLGGGNISRPADMLHQLNADSSLFVSTNGVMFTRPHIRQGLLPRLLREILETRVMVKNSMKRKEVREHKGLHRLLNARQFGLKLISNVTYGYTAAGFSGRMPCAEIADSIVQTGRDTLERAIRMVEADPNWKAKVVYGDTDSMFVLLPGRSKEEAFQIGKEIAARVTAANPRPVTLQMDKVYLPCCLLSKKRYVGYKYESPNQAEPVFEAKGIETVRRDGCNAVVKTMESVLRILFESKDLSKVRDYIERQWAKVWQGRVSIKDFIFAKEVRLGNYRQPPLAAVLSQRMASQDMRATPLYAERVPYVIVDGPPQARLVDRLQHPLSLMLRPDLYRLCASYYIEVVINRPLMRVLDLAGVDIMAWYSAWSRPRRQALAPPIQDRMGTVSRKKTDADEYPALPETHYRSKGSLAHGLPTSSGRSSMHSPTVAFASKRTIDQYYVSKHCAKCDVMIGSHRVFCQECLHSSNSLQGGLRLHYIQELNDAQRSYCLSMNTCASCVGDSCFNHALQGSGGGSIDLVRGSIMHAATAPISLAQSAPHIRVPCISLECPNQMQRLTKWRQVQHIQLLLQSVEREELL